MNVQDELRRLHKEVAGLRQAINNLIIIGTVKDTEGDKVRLKISGDGDDEVLSPKVRIAAPSGKNGGGHSQYSKPGTGEPMMLISPGGRVGKHSRALPAGPVDDHPSPGAAENDGHVQEDGNARFSIKNGSIEATVGGKGFVLDGNELRLTTTLRAKGGSRPAHYKGGVDSGGDTAVDGNDDVLI